MISVTATADNASLTQANHPEVLWAQRENEVYLTINLSDVVEPKLDLTGSKLEFSGVAKDKTYALNLDFYKEIDVEQSKKNISARCIFLILTKKQGEWWPRLMLNKSRNHWLKTDFSRWKDEDEEEEPAAFGGGMPDFDMSQFANFAGMGDLTGNQEQEQDSDDEE